MKKTILAFYFLLLFYHSSFSADGARSAGIGGASVSLSDAWSVHNNQAGLGFVRNFSAGVCYENRFLMNSMNVKSGLAAIPTKQGTFGVGFTNFGYSLFSQNKIGLAYGKSFGEKFSAGVQMDYFSTKIPEYGSKTIFCAELGIQAKPLKNLTIGAHIFNPTREKIADYNDEKIPTVMRIGLDYKFSDKVFTAIETEKDIDHKVIVKLGVEYRPVKEFFIRAGVATNPSLSCFGIGINLRNIQLDISSSYHSVLGYSPQIGLTYGFEETKPTKN